MTRQDFQLIADVIATSIGREVGNTTKQAEIRREAVRDVAYRFSAELRKTNSRFDSSRFLKACKLEG